MVPHLLNVMYLSILDPLLYRFMLAVVVYFCLLMAVKYYSFPEYVSDLSSVQTDSNIINDFCLKMQVRTPVDKCRVLSLNDGCNDRDFVFCLSGNEIPNAHVVT